MSNKIEMFEALNKAADEEYEPQLNDDLRVLLIAARPRTSFYEFPLFDNMAYSYSGEIIDFFETNHICVYDDHAQYIINRLTAIDPTLFDNWTVYITSSKKWKGISHIHRREKEQKMSQSNDALLDLIGRMCPKKSNDHISTSGDMTIGDMELHEHTSKDGKKYFKLVPKDGDDMKVENIEIGMVVQHKGSRRIAVVSELIGSSSVAIVYGNNTRQLVSITDIRSCHKTFIHTCKYVNRTSKVVYKVQYDMLMDELVMTGVGSLDEFITEGAKAVTDAFVVNASCNVDDYEPLLVVTDDPASIPFWALS